MKANMILKTEEYNENISQITNDHDEINLLYTQTKKDFDISLL